MRVEKEVLRKQIERNLKVSFGKELGEAKDFEIYRALGQAVMENIADNWYDTGKLYEKQKQAFYLSAEFLMGRALGNNLINLGMLKEVQELFDELGIDYNKVEDAEEDSALGNGGLGRLAACFLDSLATLNLPGKGYGIRYRNGIFNQEFRDGYQIEKPETWLKYGDVWSVMRPDDEVIVTFGDGSVRAVPYDMPIIGYGTNNINTLRLWEAHSLVDLDLGKFNQQDYLHATQQKTLAEDISRVLYPNDSTDEGKKLRLKQQYFFVSASLQDIVKRYKKVHGNDFDKFAEFTAIQLNDTHPVIAIPELMRIFIDIEGISWEKAWSIVEKTFAYTNHTILAEALEKWWVGLYEQVVPRVYQITQGIDNQLRELLEQKFPGDKARQDRMRIINGNMIHMAWLAIYGSHKVNGVAALHTEILKNKELKDWYELYPEKFLNKTNGITQRRWLLQSNPQLASLITELIGDAWITDLSELKKLEAYLDDEKVLKRILDIICSFGFILCFWWLYILIAILVKVKLGSPVVFKQKRPGLNGKIFTMYKFRSMTDAKDKNGNLLSDAERLPKFGKVLRATSLDEIPEFINVLKGEMSIIGPRPLLVEYLERYNAEQKRRHNVRPGITGWAQVNGRNAISWEEKFRYDVEYVDNLTFFLDVKIVFLTIKKIVVKEGISQEGNATMEKFTGASK